MQLKGLKINFLGDSITEGCGTSSADKRFTNLISAQYGAVCRNYGICGTRIAPQHVPYFEPSFDRDYIMRTDEMDPDADAVCVFGGTNDFGHGDAPFGAYGDTEPDTFCGACYTLMKKLTEKYPGKKIIIFTPLHRLGESDPKPDPVSKESHVLIDYVNIIRRTAEYFSLPVLDLYAVSRLQPAVPVIQEKYVPDGLHPNDAGHIILKDIIADYINSL